MAAAAPLARNLMAFYPALPECKVHVAFARRDEGFRRVHMWLAPVLHRMFMKRKAPLSGDYPK
jgi:hypothetical protein